MRNAPDLRERFLYVAAESSAQKYRQPPNISQKTEKVGFYVFYEGYEARAAMKHGVIYDVIKENLERRQLNAALARMEQLICDARKLLDEIREKFIKWRETHEQRRSVTAEDLIRRNGGLTSAIPGIDPGNVIRA